MAALEPGERPGLDARPAGGNVGFDGSDTLPIYVLGQVYGGATGKEANNESDKFLHGNTPLF
jgi:hypothetical protein